MRDDERRQPGGGPGRPEADPLDDLLAEARWPEPARESRERLLATWMSLHARPAYRTWLRPVAAAAAVVLAIGGTWWGVVAKVGRDAAPVTRVDVDVPIRDATTSLTTRIVSAGRAPSSLELTLVAAIERREAKARERAALSPATPPDGHPPAPVAPRLPSPPSSRPPSPRDPAADLLAAGAVDAFLSRVANPATADAALAALAAFPDPPTDALIDRLDAPRTDVRAAAARALARVDDPAVTRRLASMAAADVNRREALAALAASDAPAARAFLAAARHSEPLSAAVRSALAQHASAVH